MLALRGEEDAFLLYMRLRLCFVFACSLLMRSLTLSPSMVAVVDVGARIVAKASLGPLLPVVI